MAKKRRRVVRSLDWYRVWPRGLNPSVESYDQILRDAADSPHLARIGPSVQWVAAAGAVAFILLWVGLLLMRQISQDAGQFLMLFGVPITVLLVAGRLLLFVTVGHAIAQGMKLEGRREELALVLAAAHSPTLVLIGLVCLGNAILNVTAGVAFVPTAVANLLTVYEFVLGMFAVQSVYRVSMTRAFTITFPALLVTMAILSASTFFEFAVLTQNALR